MSGVRTGLCGSLLRMAGAFRTLFFPEVCPVCGRPLPEGMTLLCPRCLLQLPRTGFCGRRGNEMEELFACLLPLVPDLRFQVAAAFFYYKPATPYTHLVTDLKYRHRRSMARAVVEQMFRENDPHFLFPQGVDFVVPIPIHWQKRGKRGYNQSSYIARSIGRLLSAPVLERGVRRVENTPSQTALSHSRRFENVEGAFRWKKAVAESLRGRHIVLVDDVVTTGATIASCAEALCRALREEPLAPQSCEPVRVSVLSLGFSKG
ncbi:MAG: ComF family protein [Bacteroidaceae bacterium]